MSQFQIIGGGWVSRTSAPDPKRTSAHDEIRLATYCAGLARGLYWEASCATIFGNLGEPSGESRLSIVAGSHAGSLRKKKSIRLASGDQEG